MESLQKLQLSRRMLQVVMRPPHILQHPTRTGLLHTSTRKFTSTTRAHHADPSKPIVLEKPDKFRPPSHPQRKANARPRQYPGPMMSEAERYRQQTRRYPHTFPSEGTGLHWFLTNRWIHFVITMSILSLLAIITVTQSFLHTSPYADLIPPLSTLPFHPLTYASELISVLKLHTAYRSDLVAQKRAENMLDVQKRRIYRRAHGMEDLNVEEDQGIDVRGIAPWDDGLTEGERRKGGRREPWKLVVGGGDQLYDPVTQKVTEGLQVVDKNAETGYGAGQGRGETMVEEKMPEGMQEEGPRRKVKRWFGIWE